MGNTDDEDRIRPPTPPLDPAVAAISSRFQTVRISEASPESANVKDGQHDDDENALNDSEIESDEDALIAALEENEFDLGGYREKRIEELKAQVAKVKDMRETEHGKLSEIFEEKEVIRTSANEDRCVIHFYHRDFRRCAVMDKHLEIIAPRHFKTRFVRVFVENVPWLVEKLNVKVLPCVICFIRGVAKDRLIGFEELGNDDSFTTTALELRLAQSGVLEAPSSTGLKTMFGSGSGQGRTRSGIRDRERYNSDDEYDDDD